jgi:hypothetical protein
VGGGWALQMEARYQVHWIRVSGAREADGGMLMDFGVGWGP